MTVYLFLSKEIDPYSDVLNTISRILGQLTRAGTKIHLEYRTCQLIYSNTNEPVLINLPIASL